MNKKITVNGKLYTITKTKFGTSLIEGKTRDEFLEWLKLNDHVGYLEVARLGAKTAIEEPDHLKDIQSRHEDLRP